FDNRHYFPKEELCGLGGLAGYSIKVEADALQCVSLKRVVSLKRKLRALHISAPYVRQRILPRLAPPRVHRPMIASHDLVKVAAGLRKWFNDGVRHERGVQRSTATTRRLAGNSNVGLALGHAASLPDNRLTSRGEREKSGSSLTAHLLK